MGKLNNFLKSMNSFTFWLLCSVLFATSVVLILAAFQFIKLKQLKFW